MLFRAGEEAYDFIVILEGEIEIVRPDRESEAVIATRGRRTVRRRAEPAHRPARCSSPPGARARAHPRDADRANSAGSWPSSPSSPTRSSRAFFARRELLRPGEGARAMRIIGSRFSAEAMALRAFAARSRLAAHVDRRRGRGRRRRAARGHGLPAARHARCDHPDRQCCATRRPGSSPSISASRSIRSRVTCSTSWSSGAVRRASRPRSTARPKG